MVYKCFNCGAKLEIDKTTEIIRCDYCGSVNKIEMNHTGTQFKILPSQKKNASVISIIIFIVVFFIGLFIYLSMRENIPSTEITIGGVSPFSFHQDGGYLIDQNNDNALDIVTMAMMDPDGTFEIQILDGKTGSILASAESDYAQKAKLITVCHDMIFATKEDLTLTI